MWAALLAVGCALAGGEPAQAQVPPTLAEAVDREDWAFETGGSAPWFGQGAVAHDGVDAAQSGVIADGQSSWMQTTVEGATDGFITFRWQVSSEEGWDYLTFRIDGVQVAAISGEAGWHRVAFPVTAGGHAFRWEYRKDDSFDDGADAAWIDEVAFTTTRPPAGLAVNSEPGTGIFIAVSPADLDGLVDGATPFERSYGNGETVTLTAPSTAPGGSDFFSWSGCDSHVGTECTVQMTNGRFVTAWYWPSLGEALDQPTWEFARSGDVLWTTQSNSYDGSDYAFGLAEDGQTAVLETTQTFASDGYLFFRYYATFWGESALDFYLDGDLAAICTNFAEWTQAGFAVSEGVHTLRWVARAGSGATAGVYLDEISLSGAAPNYSLGVASAGANVQIQADVTDENGELGGTTPFVREYLLGTRLHLTAPPTSDAGLVFAGWAGCDGPGAPENPVCEVSMYSDRRAVAEYVISLAVAVDQPDWDFTVGGEETWEGAAWGHDGTDGASAFVWDSRTAVLETEQTFAAAGYLTFWWSGYAYGGGSLEFYFDDLDVPAAVFSGAGDVWVQRGLQVAAGTHTLRWVARAASAGILSADLDEIFFTETPPLFHRAVQSTVAGIAIDADTAGAGGTTPYTLEFPLGAVLRLTAPLFSGGLEFTAWQGCDHIEGLSNEVCVVAMISSSPVVAGYGISLSDGVDQPDWQFARSGDAAWRGQWGGHDGLDGGSVRVVDGETAAIETVRTFDAPGYVTFWWSVWGQGVAVDFYVDDMETPAGTLDAAYSWHYRSFSLGAGSHTLRWVARAGTGGDAAAWLDQVTFTPNQAPIVWDMVVPIFQVSSMWIHLPAQDPDNDPLTYRIVTPPRHGSLSGTAPDLTYTPAAGYTGTDSFCYTASDGQFESAIAWVTLRMLTPQGGVFFDDFADGAAPADWQALSGTWSASGRVYTASSLKKHNMARVARFDPPNTPLGAARIQAKIKLTTTASRSGPNGMILFGCLDAARYRWVKITKSQILIGQTGTIGGIGGGTKKKIAKAQALNRFGLYTVKVFTDGWVRVYKGTASKPVLQHQFLDGGAPSVVTGGIGLAATKAKTVFDDVSVWDSPGL